MSAYLSQIAFRSHGTTEPNALILGSAMSPAVTGQVQGIGEKWDTKITDPASNLVPQVEKSITPTGSHPEPASTLRQGSREPEQSEISYLSRYKMRAPVPQEHEIFRTNLRTSESVTSGIKNAGKEIQAPMQEAAIRVVQSEDEVQKIKMTQPPKENPAPERSQTAMSPRQMHEKNSKYQELLPKEPDQSLLTPIKTPLPTANILQPTNPISQEFKPRNPQPKLVIGRITVEIIPPIAPASKNPERPAHHRNEALSSTKIAAPQVYKLSFGLGQL